MKIESSPIKFEKSVRASEHVSVEGTLVVDGDAVIGNANSDKVGFFGTTPVDQPATVADATDAPSVILRLNEVIARLKELGLIA